MKLDAIQTFSEQVKNEICFNIRDSLQLELPILSFLKNVSEYNLSDKCIEFKTQYICIVKLFKLFCANNNQYTVQIFVSEKKKLNTDRNNYLVRLFVKDIDAFYDKVHLKHLDISDLEIAKYILIGGFLSGGSVSNPGKSSYHLEFRTVSEEYKDILINTLKLFNLSAKVLFHHSKWVIYFKKSSEISDLLKIIQAHNAMFFLEDNRIERDMVNNLQRLVNLEVFNLNKTTKAAVEQSRMCQVIQTSIYFKLLNDREQLYCEIRSSSPKASMQVICKLMNKKLPDNRQITKGGLSHIVQKIKDIYKKI